MEHTQPFCGEIFWMLGVMVGREILGYKGLSEYLHSEWLYFLNFRLYRPNLCSILVKFGRPYRASYAGRCLVKTSKRTTVLVRTDGTTYTLCFVRTHDIFKLKCTAWAVRISTYVLFVPPQLSWQPNPFTLWRHFLRMASLLLRRVALLWDVISEADERALVLFGLASLVPFITKLWNQYCIWLLACYRHVLLSTNRPGTYESARSEYCASLQGLQSSQRLAVWAALVIFCFENNTIQNNTTIATGNVVKLTRKINPSVWSDGHCPHAARSHSFVYISTS